jgi:hypothetical protein
VVLGGVAGPLVPSAGAESRLDVSAGYAGFGVPGRALPVQVTVTAERLVKGELVVKESGGKRKATLPVEVAGGSVKRFTVVLPGGVSAVNGTVDVELAVGGRALGRGKADVKAADDAELVGLGPELLGGKAVPGPVALAVDTGVARFSALDAGILAQAPAALDGLSTIGLASGELSALAPGVRAGLLRWVGAGGHLLIDTAAPSSGIGTAIDGLPAEWQPAAGAAAGRAAAGLGEVRLTGDAMTAGRWAGLVEPSSAVRNDLGGFFSPESVADSLARDAGLRLPKLAWLLGFLGVYIAVVGPVTGFVLRWRRRPDLAWVAVPGLAVLFTVLAYVAGNQLRPGAGLAHGSIVETGTSGPVATSWVALTRRTAGTARVDLPSGWVVEGALSAQSGQCFGDCSTRGNLEPPSVGVGNAGPEVQLPLASGEFGVFKASGPVALAGRLEVTASSGGDGVATGTVRNGLPFAIEQVVVFVGPSYRARVGKLAPGEQRSWSVGPGDRMSDPGGTEAWMSDMGFQPGGLVNFSLWQSAAGDLGQDGDPTGTAMAVGWTRDWKPAVTVDGRERPAPGRTAIVGRVPVTAAGDRVTDLVVGADVVRGPSLNPFRGKWVGNNAGEASVVKLTLPPGAADRRLVLQTSLPLSDLAVWQAGAWRHLDIPFNPNDLQAMLRFKRGVAVKGGGFIVDTAPAPPTTAPPAVIAPGQVPVPTTVPVAPGVGVAVPVPAPPMVGPDGGLVARGNAAVQIPLPAGLGSDGVIFVRLMVDPSGGLGPDAVLSLREVGQ